MSDFTTVHKRRRFGRVTIEYVTSPDAWWWEDLGDMLGEFKYQQAYPNLPDSDSWEEDPPEWVRIHTRNEGFWWKPHPEDEDVQLTRTFIENVCKERIIIATVGVVVRIDGIKRGSAYCGLVTVERAKDIYDAIKEYGLVKEAWDEAMQELAVVYDKNKIPRRFR